MARPWTSLDVELMVVLYGQGLGVDQVGVVMGVTGSTVSRRLRAAGVRMRPAAAPRMPVDDQEILRLRREGLLWREVAEQVGMTLPGVHARWRRLRDAGHLDPRPAAPSDTVRAAALHHAGASTAEIATAVGRAPNTVARKLKAAGVGVRRGPVRMVDDAELLRLRGEGLTWREVAERVGMTQSGVTFRWGLLRRAGQQDPKPS